MCNSRLFGYELLGYDRSSFLLNLRITNIYVHFLLITNIYVHFSNLDLKLVNIIIIQIYHFSTRETVTSETKILS